MNVEFLTDLSDEVRDVRISVGITQQSLATKCGVTVQAINYIENGSRTPSIDLLHRIAEALNCRLQIRLISRAVATIDMRKDVLK